MDTIEAASLFALHLICERIKPAFWTIWKCKNNILSTKDWPCVLFQQWHTDLMFSQQKFFMGFTAILTIYLGFGSRLPLFVWSIYYILNRPWINCECLVIVYNASVVCLLNILLLIIANRKSLGKIIIYLYCSI